MASIRTPEQIQQMLQQRKEIKERQRQREKKKYEKARQQVKKELQQKNKIKEQPQQPTTAKITYKVTVYDKSLIERFTAEEDLYQTWEELKEAEDRGEGALNWEVLEKLIEKLRKNLGSRRV